ncbi:hypothetical protein HNR42_002888 [Deinobacterium chartae]|uniref:Uncharacterized protein n=1 Tax=Deinobacterium chartae TaxID=521158 RepID=A0A841I185_9DEIO|nr:hypothetical protein [Deinobacterium chartae]
MRREPPYLHTLEAVSAVASTLLSLAILAVLLQPRLG